MEALLGLARANGARFIRFGAVGAATFVLNVGLLVLFKRAGMPSIPAYAAALALAVQFNFLCSQLWVWRDRRATTFWGRETAQRWLTYHGCTGASLVINLAAFSLAQIVMPDLLAVMAGVAASTLAKFLSLDRLAFREDVERPGASQDLAAPAVERAS